MKRVKSFLKVFMLTLIFIICAQVMQDNKLVRASTNSNTIYESNSTIENNALSAQWKNPINKNYIKPLKFKNGYFYSDPVVYGTVSNIQDFKNLGARALMDKSESFIIYYTGDSQSLINIYQTLLQNFMSSVDDYTYYTVASGNWIIEQEQATGKYRLTMNVVYMEDRSQSAYVDQQTTIILSNIINPNMNVDERVKAVHDYIVSHVAYDTSLQRFSAYSALSSGTTVCQGYSLLAYKMFTKLGLNARIVQGVSSPNAVGVEDDHAWNMVLIRGNWYQIDTTWDDPLPDVPNRVLYNYYNLTNSQLRLVHTWQEASYPIASTDYKNNLVSLVSANDGGYDSYLSILKALGYNITPLLKVRYSLDYPTNGATISNSFNVGGWALSGKGIKSLSVLLDGIEYKANYGVYRPDVNNAYPDYKNNYSGFSYDFDISKIKSGNHSLSLKIIEADDNITTTSPITINIASTLKYSLDFPYSNQEVNGSTYVGGWALSQFGVNDIKVIIDGNQYDAIMGVERKDVYNVYNKYNNMNSGFYYIFNSSSLLEGNHTVSLKITEGNGDVTVTAPRQFKVISSLKYSFDYPRNGDSLIEPTRMFGWALSKSGISKIEVLVDGNAMTSTYGSSRLDVYNAYKDYNNENSGFYVDFNPGSLLPGNHKIVLKIYEGNGSISYAPERTITVPNTLIYSIDSPINNQTIASSVDISGWILSKAGVSKVELLIDDVLQNNNVTGNIQRIDVFNAYPSYNNKNSGYYCSFDARKLLPGNHSFALRITEGNGGVTTTAKRNVFVSDTLMYCIDTPSNNTKVDNSMTISGWALSQSNISKIEAIIDGNSYTIDYAISRADVYNAFKQYNNVNSGFMGTIDTSKWSSGNHIMYLRITEYNGKVTMSPGRVLVR